MDSRKRILKEWSKEFFDLYPNGTMDEYISFVRKKEGEDLESKFEEYKRKKLKEIKFFPDKY